MQPPASLEANNRILSALPPEEWLTLHEHAEFVSLPTGHVLYQVGDPWAFMYFPFTGLLASFAMLSSGDQVALAAVGAEGSLGKACLLGVPTVPFQVRVLVPSNGHKIPATAIQHAFDRCQTFRRLILNETGQVLVQVARSVACSRFHAQRERVARWLLAITTKTDQPAVAITHELLAQILGGPRHAITAVIAEFRAKGLVQQVRGEIDVLNPAALAEVACECHRMDLESSS
jgi:CRP-like cAMP-binding protein